MANNVTAEYSKRERIEHFIKGEFGLSAYDEKTIRLVRFIESIDRELELNDEISRLQSVIRRASDELVECLHP